MVEGIGSATTGSLRDFDLYNQYYSQYLAYNQSTGGDLSFEAYLRLKGRIGYFNQQLENYLETGNANYGDGTNGNTIDDNRHVVNGNKTIYQSQDEDTYYEFDFENATYRVIQGSDEAAQALGFGTNNVDTLDMGYKSATATDYTFGNLDDGQDSTKSYVVSGYGNVAYVQQEFDVHYILNALLMNPNDPQYQIAEGIFQDLTEHLIQWCPQADIDALDQIAAQYGVESAEYKNKLKDVLLSNLDQANEWVETHAHVEYTPESAVLQAAEEEKAAQEAAAQETTEETSTPQYDKERILNDSGVLQEYSRGTWTSSKVSWKNDAGKDTDKCREMAKAQANEYATGLLNSLENTLVAQLGDSCTDEIKNYISKAKTTVLTRQNWLSTEWHSAMLGKNRGFTATCNTKTLVDEFFNEFNTLCQNQGKTTEEVEAEKKAEEERQAREKSDYQSLYNMDFRSTADDAGVSDTVTAVPTGSNQFNEIQAKAEQDILIPLKNKIKSQYSGRNIPQDELEALLENAAKDALASPTKWATTSNNYSYTINSNALIDLFKEGVKTGIKAKGYEF